jgi:hypothetical protein
MDQIRTNFLVCTCEKTKDVAFHMLTSFFKCVDPMMNLRIYLGSSIRDLGDFAKSKVQVIETPQTNWKDETIFQLKYLKNQDPSCQYIVLLLDDFIFKGRINSNEFYDLILHMKKEEIKYLSLKPSFDNVFLKIVDFFKSREISNNLSIYKVRNSHPYFYSLQAAIWNIDYLLNSLERCENIWHFENMNPSNEDHFALNRKILNYTHIVEKGEWDYQASELCINSIGFFNPGNRKFRNSNLMSRILVYVKSIFFLIFGYSFLRIRKVLNKFK